MPHFQLPHCNLYYTIDDHTDPWTSPETVLFVHGFTETTEAWRAWVPHFSRRHRVLRIDQRGFGRSGGIPSGYTLTTQRFIEDLAEVIRQVAQGPVHIVGGKSGGISVMMLAATRPDLVKTVTAVCSPVTPPAAEGWIEEMERDGVRSWAKRTQRTRMGSQMPEAGIEWWTDLMGETALSTVRAYLTWVSGIDIREDIKRIQCPTLVIGTETPWRGRAVFESWQRTIRKSELAILKLDGYHAAASAPDVTARITRAFIDKHSA